MDMPMMATHRTANGFWDRVRRGSGFGYAELYGWLEICTRRELLAFHRSYRRALRLLVPPNQGIDLGGLVLSRDGQMDFNRWVLAQGHGLWQRVIRATRIREVLLGCRLRPQVDIDAGLADLVRIYWLAEGSYQAGRAPERVEWNGHEWVPVRVSFEPGRRAATLLERRFGEVLLTE